MYEKTFNKMSDPTRAYNRAHSGRTSRRQMNHAKANKPWFGPVVRTAGATIDACPECFMIRKACECDV